ncbi:hypothetical protein FAUST_4707 [Fusarium austroamericanum]|uniref:Uncharacterized protein n=1 Tax=Fusarium austroamericanum TaxID=282268 RepID=A0AAN6C2I3_FUSAU|nr:hypothetical protein FAUST_4707 [Fusarium austroamericanum]
MSSRQTNYFLAPVGNPPEGPIRLGNIISNPAFADDAINEVYYPPTTELIEHNQPKFTFDMSVKKDRSFGVWVSFLQTLGIGGDAIVDWSKESSEQWACENLKTVSFSPKLSYINECLEDEGVQHYMRVNKPWVGPSKLYMITGIKIAYGAASTIEYARQRDLNLKFGTDFSSLGVPISLGPEVGSSDTLSTRESQSGAEPFVFAFRLRKIKISRKGEVNHERYTKGTLLGGKKNGEKQDVDADAEAEVVVEGVEDFDADGEEFGLSSKDTFDDDSAGNAWCKAVIVENYDV